MNLMRELIKEFMEGLYNNRGFICIMAVMILPFIPVIYFSGHNAGDCVYVSVNDWGETPAIKAEYIKFDDGAHWYIIDGEIQSVLGKLVHVTSCED